MKALALAGISSLAVAAVPQNALRFPYTVIDSRESQDVPPRALKDLLNEDGIVAIGTVVRKIDEGFYPVGGGLPAQYMVFEFRVKRYLHDTGSRPQSLSVVISQGHLPWKEKASGKTGPGMRLTGIPLPRVGGDYLVFLGRITMSSGWGPASLNDRTKPLFDQEQYVPAHLFYGLWSIEKGVVGTPSDDEIPPFAPLRFKDGPQLLGQTWQSAGELIRQAFLDKYVNPSEAKSKKGIPPRQSVH